MSELVIFVGRYFLAQLFYGGMIWILICLFLYFLTETKSTWAKDISETVGYWTWQHLPMSYAIGWAYMIFYY